MMTAQHIGERRLRAVDRRAAGEVLGGPRGSKPKPGEGLPPTPHRQIQKEKETQRALFFGRRLYSMQLDLARKYTNCGKWVQDSPLPIDRVYSWDPVWICEWNTSHWFEHPNSVQIQTLFGWWFFFAWLWHAIGFYATQDSVIILIRWWVIYCGLLLILGIHTHTRVSPAPLRVHMDFGIQVANPRIFIFLLFPPDVPPPRGCFRVRPTPSHPLLRRQVVRLRGARGPAGEDPVGQGSVPGILYASHAPTRP